MTLQVFLKLTLANLHQCEEQSHSHQLDQLQGLLLPLTRLLLLLTGSQVGSLEDYLDEGEVKLRMRLRLRLRMGMRMRL